MASRASQPLISEDEIASDELMSDLISRVRDHLKVGVKQVIVVDPRRHLPGEDVDLDFGDLFLDSVTRLL